MSFFKSVNNDEFDELFEQVVDIIFVFECIIFVGVGIFGVLVKYGVCFFFNVGKFSNYIDDFYFLVINDMVCNVLVIVFFVFGEMEEILCFVSQFSLYYCKVMLIISYEYLWLVKLVDFNFFWYVLQMCIGGVYDIIM